MLDRTTTTTAAAWYLGAVGIGLAHLNLDSTLSHASTRKFGRRAVAATWRLGMDWNHCACHGDLGAWELLDHAIASAVRLQQLAPSYPASFDAFMLFKRTPHPLNYTALRGSPTLIQILFILYFIARHR